MKPEEEIEGLDIHEHGAPGYADDVLASFDYAELDLTDKESATLSS